MSRRKYRTKLAETVEELQKLGASHVQAMSWAIAAPDVVWDPDTCPDVAAQVIWRRKRPGQLTFYFN